MMLRLFILFLILQGSAAASDDTEGNSSGNDGPYVDDEDFGNKMTEGRSGSPLLESEGPVASPGSDRSKGDEAGGDTLVIIIAAVSVAILAIGGIVAIVLFRRYLHRREQGVYSVPVEQGQKAAV
ncbi:hypothetical protein R3I93_004394 [Phoxinus phoxinus]|uniref:Uncharacterized protein n=1 Tax=Phoxinus phoxinus TaxID=58324 RepID=A0AAN9DIT0_9TELE